MTITQVVETSVTVNNKSPIQDYVHPDDHTQPTYEMVPGFKHFISVVCIQKYFNNKNVVCFVSSSGDVRVCSISIEVTAIQIMFQSNMLLAFNFAGLNFAILVFSTSS